MGISYKLKNFIDKIYMKIFYIKTELIGIDVVTEILPQESGLDPKKVKRCTHSNTRYLNKVLRRLRINKNDSILDIGCSKGGALLCMSNFKFNRISGIEISKALVDIAKSNFNKLGNKKVEIINVDALNYDSYSKYNIFYFYNSLVEETLREVLKKILENNKYSEFFIIYNNPKYDYVFYESSLNKILDMEGNWDHRIHVYCNVKKPIKVISQI